MCIISKVHLYKLLENCNLSFKQVFVKTVWEVLVAKQSFGFKNRSFNLSKCWTKWTTNTGIKSYCNIITMVGNLVQFSIICWSLSLLYTKIWRNSTIELTSQVLIPPEFTYAHAHLAQKDVETKAIILNARKKKSIYY